MSAQTGAGRGRSVEPDAVGITAERLAQAVSAVDGVTGLHGGVFGEIATYLPGGRVSGVTLSADRGHVHIIVDTTHDLREVAAQVKQVASDIAGVPVDVTVEDVSLPDASAPEPQDDLAEVKNDG